MCPCRRNSLGQWRLQPLYMTVTMSVSVTLTVSLTQSQLLPGAYITKNPNFDPISTFTHFHKKVRIEPNFLYGNERKLYR